MTPLYLICTVCHRRWNVSRLRDDPRPYLCPFCRTQNKTPPTGLPSHERRDQPKPINYSPIMGRMKGKVNALLSRVS